MITKLDQLLPATYIGFSGEARHWKVTWILGVLLATFILLFTAAVAILPPIGAVYLLTGWWKLAAIPGTLLWWKVFITIEISE